jgi:hypothetical protein
MPGAPRTRRCRALAARGIFPLYRSSSPLNFNSSRAATVPLVIDPQCYAMLSEKLLGVYATPRQRDVLNQVFGAGLITRGVIAVDRGAFAASCRTPGFGRRRAASTDSVAQRANPIFSIKSRCASTAFTSRRQWAGDALCGVCPDGDRIHGATAAGSSSMASAKRTPTT